MSQAYQVRQVDASKSHLSPHLLNNLSLTTVSIPEPSPRTVLIRVHAVALNFRDLLVLSNTYPSPTSEGLIPCMDGAGEIVSVGLGSKWKDNVGASVFIGIGKDWIDGDVSALRFENTLGAGAVGGTLSQYIVLDDGFVHLSPKHMSFEEAATLSCAGGTAFNVLTSVKIGKDSTVVTQGTGGVSCFVIQFAAALGARVIATSSSDEKLQLAKRLGASDLINYKTTPDWAEEVLRLTGNKGVDLVADVAGTIEQSLKALRLGGTACVIGAVSSAPEPVEVVWPLILHAKTLRGILGYSVVMLEQLVELVEKHRIKPVVGKIFEWEDAPEAFEVLRKQDTVGKIVIRV